MILGGIMKKRYILTALSFLTVFLVLTGCGGSGTGDAPGSRDSEKTGILVTASLSLDSPNIDAAIHLCDDGLPEPGLFDDFAIFTINAELVNPGYDTFPGSIKSCNITYLPSIENPDVPPIEFWERNPTCVFEDGVTNCSVDFIDISRKIKWWDDIVSGRYDPITRPSNYVAKYNCVYFNKWGDEGGFETRIGFRIDDYDLCE
jgi:hypothetical protein